MHFRTRNRVIQVIRTSYNPTSKRAKAQVLGSVNRIHPEISDELRLICKPQELAELKAFVKNQQMLTRVELENAARTLVAQMQKATEWFDTAQINIENEMLVGEINRHMLLLRKKMLRLLKNNEPT
jgi:hypothetical protein